MLTTARSRPRRSRWDSSWSPTTRRISAQSRASPSRTGRCPEAIRAPGPVRGRFRQPSGVTGRGACPAAPDTLHACSGSRPGRTSGCLRSVGFTLESRLGSNLMLCLWPLRSWIGLAPSALQVVPEFPRDAVSPATGGPLPEGNAHAMQGSRIRKASAAPYAHQKPPRSSRAAMASRTGLSPEPLCPLPQPRRCFPSFVGSWEVPRGLSRHAVTWSASRAV